MRRDVSPENDGTVPVQPHLDSEAAKIRDTSEPGEEEPHGQGSIAREGRSGDSAEDAPVVLGRSVRRQTKLDTSVPFLRDTSERMAA